MKIYLYMLILFGFMQLPVYSQQRIDSAVVSSWPSVHYGSISPDGRYVSYEVQKWNRIGSASLSGNKRVIKQVRGKWQMEFNRSTSAPVFSPDSKRCYLLLLGDTLLKIVPEKGVVSTETDISDFSSQGDYLFYRQKRKPRSLSIVDMVADRAWSVDDVDTYTFSSANKSLLITATGQNKVTLSLYLLTQKTLRAIWQGDKARGFILDRAGDKIGFVTDSKLMVADHSGITAVMRLPDSLQQLELTGWTRDQRNLMFSVEKNVPEPPATGPADLSIWDSRNTGIPFGHAVEKAIISAGIVNLGNRKITVLAGPDERIIDCFGDHALLINSKIEKNVIAVPLSEPAIRYSWTGQAPSLSGNGKYLLYLSDGDYYAVNLKTGITFNLTAKIRSGGRKFTQLGSSQLYWKKADEALVISDLYDLWLMDPSGKQKPVCLTVKVGAERHIRLAPLQQFSDRDLSTGNRLLLTGFDEQTKRSGFYELIIGSKSSLRKLNDDGYYYYSPLSGPIENAFDNVPVKASNTRVWLVKRMKAIESPNYCVTNDFMHFQPLSDVHPEKDYKWFSTKLYTWKLANGEKLQGILYQPEHFDPKKKHPLILYYYETFSRNLEAFLEPGMSVGPINIPWMVSRGYFVFVPDIDNKEGNPGATALEVVISAADQLQREPFIDSAKIGIQGHSFGGFETYYILSHSARFAAACASSGVSDLISFAGGLSHGKSGHEMTSTGQIRLGASLWERPDLYLKNSAVLNADKISTPLLAMHTGKDAAVPVGQGIEMFQAMQQLKKPAWLLLYADENHVLRKPENAMDYTKRMVEFFDHYLKGEPLPEWMKLNP